MFKRLTVWAMTQALVLVQTTAIAQTSHDQGVAAGRAANTTIRGMVNQPSATGVVPGYTTTPPEAALAGRPALGPEVSAKLAACAAMPNEPSCQALRTAITSANTARAAIFPTDPAVAAASRIARNPSLDLGSLASYYSGCRNREVTIAAHTETRWCSRFPSNASQSCFRSLQVDVERGSNCQVGTWFSKASSGSTAVATQCLPDRPDTRQHFRVTSAGTPLAYFDVDMTRNAVRPEKVATLEAAWAGFAAGTAAVYVSDRACSDTRCGLTALVASDSVVSCTGDWDSLTCMPVHPFIDLFDACPGGTQSGDKLLFTVCNGTGIDVTCNSKPLDTGTCYAPSDSPDAIPAIDITSTYPAALWVASTSRAVIGWQPNPAYGPIPQIRLDYTKAVSTSTTADTWNDFCPALDAERRCTVAEPICVDGPSTKVIDGVSVTRECWRYQRSISCAGSYAADQCEPLITAGCQPQSSRCARNDPATGACEEFQEQYTCSVPTETVTQASDCPNNVFCIGESCFNTAYTTDADFGRTMSMLEAAREAGVYLDTDRLEVFKGEAHGCRDRLLKNCCASDPTGRGMTNQSVFGSGSRLVYDILMNAENREFIYRGLGALLTSAGFSGSFTTYGVTIAVNGTALPAGSSVLFSSSPAAGEGFVIAFDPWSLAISAVIYVVLSFASCNQSEASLALKEGARLCHTVGEYCSSCLRFFGACVSCIETTTSKCCFNSVLARIVNEQGRLQIGKDWGKAKEPLCSGFSVAQLQSLDFARMDLSEFYASLVANSPNLSAIQTNNGARVPSCYFGQGKC